MNTIEAEAVLRRFNRWRRYDGPQNQSPPMPDPTYIGEAIDLACEILKEYNADKREDQ